MRTNLDLDDRLLTKARKVLGTSTKKATVEEALRRAIQSHERRKAIEKLRGIGWEGNLDEMREGRNFDHIK